MEHPNNGYALLGVTQALKALGRDADAAQMEGVYKVSWPAHALHALHAVHRAPQPSACFIPTMSAPNTSFSAIVLRCHACRLRRGAWHHTELFYRSCPTVLNVLT